MFKFAFKNMLVKRVKIALIIFSIVLSASVAILAYNISAQVDDGIKTTAEFYDTIVGPAGSDTDLAMTTMFFTGSVTETISYEYYEQLANDMRVNVAIPFAMGDAYNGAKIIGTTAPFLKDKDIDRGEMFKDTFEAVVGYEVAKANGLELGDALVTSHGISGTGHDHAATPLVVVGILEKTNTAYDNVVFVEVETVWAIHDHGEEESETGGQLDTTLDSHKDDAHIDEHSDAHEGDHSDTHTEDEQDHEHEHKEICAVLVKCKSAGYVSQVQGELRENSKLLVITPMEVMNEVLDNVDTSVYIVYVLCVIILIMNLCIISVITLLNMYDSKKEIALMRLIGIGMNKVNLLYIIQNGIIGFVSTLLAFGVSRLSLMAARDYVSSMGVVLDVTRVYSLELVIMAVVFVISVLPTVICTLSMSRKDGISE